MDNYRRGNADRVTFRETKRHTFNFSATLHSKMYVPSSVCLSWKPLNSLNLVLCFHLCVCCMKMKSCSNCICFLLYNFVFLDFGFGANISQSKKPLQKLNVSLVSKCLKWLKIQSWWVYQVWNKSIIWMMFKNKACLQLYQFN